MITAEEYLFEKGYSRNDQKEGYILKVEEMIELLDGFIEERTRPKYCVCISTFNNFLNGKCIACHKPKKP